MLFRSGRPAVAMSLVGVVALAIGFASGIFLLRWMLSASHPVIGVARAIVEEAIGTRLSILLVMLVVVSLPMLPLLLSYPQKIRGGLPFPGPELLR